MIDTKKENLYIIPTQHLIYKDMKISLRKKKEFKSSFDAIRINWTDLQAEISSSGWQQIFFKRKMRSLSLWRKRSFGKRYTAANADDEEKKWGGIFYIIMIYFGWIAWKSFTPGRIVYNFLIQPDRKLRNKTLRDDRRMNIFSTERINKLLTTLYLSGHGIYKT